MRKFALALISLCLAATAARANLTAGVSNAPIWQPSTSYSAPAAPARFGSRFNSGPGTVGGTYTAGSAVYVWEVLTTGTSGVVPPGTGGLPCTTPGTTVITESTGLQSKCLGIIDYSTLGGYLFDCPAYPTGTPTLFHYHQCVKNVATGQIYRADQSSTGNPNTGNPADGTTAGGSSPSGTTNGQTDGTVYWDYIGTLLYWSGNNGPIPAQYYPPGLGIQPVSQTTQQYTANLFHGGIGAPEYVANAGGEPPSFLVQGHNDCTYDGGLGLIGNENCTAGYYSNTYFITITCAPIDCPSTSAALKYDNTQFVSIHNTAAASTPPIGTGTGLNVSIPTNYPATVHRDTAISQQDSFVSLSGIVIKSDNGVAIEGARPNYLNMQNSLADAGGPLAVYTDAGSIFLNSVIIDRSSAVGAGGVMSSYAILVENTTIYMPNGSSTAACILPRVGTTVFGNPLGASGNPYWSNTGSFGCPIWAAIWTSQLGNWAPDGVKQFGNVTSAAATSSSPAFTSAFEQEAFTGLAPAGVSASTCGGSCASQVFASNFGGASDLRALAGAPMLPAGATFSLTPGLNYGTSTFTNATDLFGAARPQGSNYVPGATNAAASTALATMPLGGIVP